MAKICRANSKKKTLGSHKISRNVRQKRQVVEEVKQSEQEKHIPKRQVVSPVKVYRTRKCCYLNELIEHLEAMSGVEL